MRVFLMAVLFLSCLLLVTCSEKSAQQQSVSSARSQADSLVSNLVTDPVCGMELDKTQIKLTTEFNGETYYFCNESEKIAFEKNPERFLSAE